MSKHRKTTIIRFFVLAAAAVALTAPACAQDSCQPIYDALSKLAGTPSHSYAAMTESASGERTTTEFIFFQDKSYMKVGDRWADGPMSPKELLGDELEKRKTARPRCQVVRADTSQGQAATLYFLHSESKDVKEDLQIWVSRASGLPLREESDIEISGTPGKRHLSNRYEYGNVRAPK